MADTFPDIAVPDYPLEEEIKDHSLKMQMDNETILTRPKYTKMPQSFKLTWSHMTTADYNKLRAFYKDRKGGALAFSWTYPTDAGNDLSGQTFTVRFDDESLNFKLTSVNYWEGTITLREAL